MTDSSFRLHSHAAVRLRADGKRRAFPVTTTVVRPDVWAAAMKAVDGDTSRLVVISDTEVYAVNNSARTIPRPPPEDPRIERLAAVIAMLTETDAQLARELAIQVWAAARP